MCDTVFTFGQRGGFCFDSTSKFRYGGLPSTLDSLFAAGIVTIHCLVLGARDTFFISYKDKEQRNHIVAEGLPGALHDFLFETDASGENVRNFGSIQVALGPYNASWYATDGSAWKWLGLPKDLDEALETRWKAGTWTDKPRLVALGADDNFYMATERHAASWLLTRYKALDRYITSFRDDDKGQDTVQNLVLNAYRYQSFVLECSNGQVVYGNVPQHMQDAMKDMERTVRADTVKLRAASGGNGASLAQSALLDIYLGRLKLG